MDIILPFSTHHLEAACKVLTDTEHGLNSQEIGNIFQLCRLEDVTPERDSWKRLFNALANAQNHHRVGNHLIMFINRALNPVSYARNKKKFAWRRTELNNILSSSGLSIREDGKVIRAPNTFEADG